MMLDGVGMLYLTDRRIIFIGDIRTTITPITNVISEGAFDDGFHIDIANGSPLNYETGTRDAHVAYARIANNMTRAWTPEEIDQASVAPA